MSYEMQVTLLTNDGNKLSVKLPSTKGVLREVLDKVKGLGVEVYVTETSNYTNINPSYDSGKYPEIKEDFDVMQVYKEVQNLYRLNRIAETLAYINADKGKEYLFLQAYKLSYSTAEAYKVYKLLEANKVDGVQPHSFKGLYEMCAVDWESESQVAVSMPLEVWVEEEAPDKYLYNKATGYFHSYNQDGLFAMSDNYKEEEQLEENLNEYLIDYYLEGSSNNLEDLKSKVVKYSSKYPGHATVTENSLQSDKRRLEKCGLPLTVNMSIGYAEVINKEGVHQVTKDTVVFVPKYGKEGVYLKYAYEATIFDNLLKYHTDGNVSKAKELLKTIKYYPEIKNQKDLQDKLSYKIMLDHGVPIHLVALQLKAMSASEKENLYKGKLTAKYYYSEELGFYYSVQL